MIRRLFEKLKLVEPCQPHLQQANVVGCAMFVTLDWNGNPITTKGDGYILPRKAEMIINAKYYPNGIVGEWPCHPETGQQLPIDDLNFIGSITKEPCSNHNPIKLGYLEWQDWAENKTKQGEKQKQCTKCGRWYFNEEF